MLPVVRGDRETARQIVLYSIVPRRFHARRRPLARAASTPSSALVLGAAFLVARRALRRDLSRRRARVLFHYSLAYLALLFVAAAIDPLLT